MEALQFIKLEKGALQILAASRSFIVKAAAVSFASESITFNRVSLFSKYVSAECKDLSYLNLFVDGDLTVFRHISTLEGIEVEEHRIVAYFGVTLRRSFKNYNCVVLEHDTKAPPNDVFVVLQSSHRLVIKQLGEDEILKVRKGSVVLKNIEGRLNS